MTDPIAADPRRSHDPAARRGGSGGSGGPVRIAVLGCGRIAQLIHLPILQTLAGAQVVALAEPDATSRAAAHGKFPFSAADADWRETLRREEVDAIVISLPTHLHADAAIAALGAGKHVYLEKPVATDAESARRLVEAADRSPQVGMAGFNFRFHPTFRALRQRLLSGEIGELVAINTVFAVPPRPLPSWKTDRRTGGGALLDQFSHHADLLRFLLTGVADFRPESVTARVRGVRSEGDTAAVQTTLASGVVVQSTLSMTTAEQDRIEILGTEGKLTADRIAMQCWFEPAGGGYTRPDRFVRLVESSTRSLSLLRHVLRPLGTTGHAAALGEFVAAITESRPASCTLQEGAHSLAWVLAAEESARAGAATNVDPAAVGLSTEAPSASATMAGELPLSREMPALSFPEIGEDRPLVSVVLVGSVVDESVRNVVRCIRRQSVAKQIELIVVAESDEAASRLVELEADERETLGWVQAQGLGRPVDNVDAEAARGIHVSRGPVTAVIEDHAFPAEDWVERMVAAYRVSGAMTGATGSMVRNANPDSPLSWMNLLIAYGTWFEPLSPGELVVGNHNVSFRTDAVTAYGETLGERLTRSGTIMNDLRRRGFDVLIAPEARVYHTNPSRLASTLRLRIDGGRLYAASKATAERWPLWRRAGYTVLSPVIAVVRWRLLRPKLPAAGVRSWPAIAFGLLLDAIGQGMGFAFGPGGTARRLQAFEIGRLRHLNRRDQQVLSALHLTFDPDLA